MTGKRTGAHRAPKKPGWTLAKIADRARKGYGQGTGSSYVPWIGIRDLSSKGTSTRLWSPKLVRMLQFLSNIERDAFLVAEFRDDFLDYWEQWPLDRERSQRAAEQLGYRHPIYIGTRIQVVMTVDGVLTQRRGKKTVQKVIDCKDSGDLENPRTMEKLAIARRVCLGQHLRHILVTEQSTPPQRIKNIEWVRAAFPKRGEIQPVQDAFSAWPDRMLSDLRRRAQSTTLRETALNSYCKSFDTRFDLPNGFALRCIKILMWQHRIEFDLDEPSPERLPLSSLALTQTHRGSAQKDKSFAKRRRGVPAGCDSKGHQSLGRSEAKIPTRRARATKSRA